MDKDTKLYSKALAWIVFFLMVAMVATSMLSCSSTTKLEKKYIYVQDSSAQNELRKQLDSFREISSSLRQEKEHILEQLETVLSGTSGQPDTVYPGIPIRSRRLTAGEDYIDVTGQWLYLDYTWHRARRTSTTSSVVDSSSSRADSFRQRLSKKEIYIHTLQQKISSLEQKKTRGYSFFHVLIIGLGAFIGGLLVGKFLL